MKTVEIMRTGMLFVHYKVTCKHKLHLKEKEKKKGRNKNKNV